MHNDAMGQTRNKSSLFAWIAALSQLGQIGGQLVGFSDILFVSRFPVGFGGGDLHSPARSAPLVHQTAPADIDAVMFGGDEQFFGGYWIQICKLLALVDRGAEWIANKRNKSVGDRCQITASETMSFSRFYASSWDQWDSPRKLLLLTLAQAS